MGELLLNIEEKVYYRRIDYLRIISCILVLLYHLNILQGGFLAVCTFFTLSGYLSFFSALSKKEFSIKKYYLSRLKKVYLPLLIVVMLTVIIFQFYQPAKWINIKPESISAIFGYNNYWQLNANLDYFTRHNNSPFMHLWYIAILLQYELIFPIAFVILKKIDEKINKHISTIVVALLTIVTTIAFYHFSKTENIMTVYYSSFLRSFSFFFGILFAILHYKYDFKIAKPFKNIKNLMFLIYTIALIILCTFVPDTSSNYALFLILATIISARIIEYATLKNNKGNNKIFSFISNSTYEVYLVQYPVMFFAQSLIINNTLKTITIITLTIIISLLLHGLLNNSVKNKIVKILTILGIIAIIVCGSVVLINEVNHTKEMQELEAQLNDNLKEIEEKNKEYLNDINKEKEEWNKVLADIEIGESKIKEIVTNLPVVGIGDSVLLAASPGLYKVFPNGYFDGKVSRTIVGGRELLEELIAEGKVGDTIILALANNGDYIIKRNKDLMEVVGDRKVFWVNAVLADIPEFNENFKEFAEDYPNLYIVDWEEASKDHPEYFYADGIHVKGDGINAYANLVYDAIYNVYLDEYKSQFKDEIEKHENEINTKTKLLEENNSRINEINDKLDDLKN